MVTVIQNAFEFGQVPNADEAMYYMKVNGQIEFTLPVPQDWLQKCNLVAVLI